MRRNSLILQKKFSTRWRHLYISKSQGIVVTRLALGGITATAPRLSNSVRNPSLSKALSASRGAKSRSARSRATPTASCRSPGNRTNRTRLPSASTSATILVVKPPRERPMACVLVPPFAPVPCWCTRTMVPSSAIDDDVLEVGIRRQGFEKLIKHAASNPPTESLKHRVPLPEILGKVAPGRSNPNNPENRLDKKSVVSP